MMRMMMTVSMLRLIPKMMMTWMEMLLFTKAISCARKNSGDAVQRTDGQGTPFAGTAFIYVHVGFKVTCLPSYRRHSAQAAKRRVMSS